MFKCYHFMEIAKQNEKVENTKSFMWHIAKSTSLYQIRYTGSHHFVLFHFEELKNCVITI